jgi:hypothetical protein
MKYTLKRSIFKSGAIDIACHPIVIKDGRRDFSMIHIIGGASDTSIICPRLPDKFEEVVDARQNVVHEYDGVEIFVFGFTELVERNKNGITDFGEIFDAVVELTSGTLRCSNHDTHADTLR